MNNTTFDIIADGLAEKGYAVVDGFLTASEVSDILAHETFRQGTTTLKRAGIGKSQSLQVNESIRGDYIQWMDKKTAPTPAKVYLDRLDALIAFLNPALYLSLKDVEVHFTIYPVGSFYKRHLDRFKTDDHRILSVICYLNEQWTDADGGQLRMHLPDSMEDFLPLGGRLICFRSDRIEHEVLPARRERLSLTGWMLDRPLDVPI